MARPGKFDHLKPEILAKFQEGMTAAQIAKIYPQMSFGTVYDWFNQFRENSEKNSEIPRNQSQSRSYNNPPRLQIVSSHNLEVPSSEEDDSESEGESGKSDVENSRKVILWVRRKLITEMRRANGPVLAQLANAVLRSAEVLQKLPEQSEEEPKEPTDPDHLFNQIMIVFESARRRKELAEAQAQMNDDAVIEWHDSPDN